MREDENWPLNLHNKLWRNPDTAICSPSWKIRTQAGEELKGSGGSLPARQDDTWSQPCLIWPDCWMEKSHEKQCSQIPYNHVPCNSCMFGLLNVHSLCYFCAELVHHNKLTCTHSHQIIINVRSINVRSIYVIIIFVLVAPQTEMLSSCLLHTKVRKPRQNRYQNVEQNCSTWNFLLHRQCLQRLG